jgi:hypothetical protein
MAKIRLTANRAQQRPGSPVVSILFDIGKPPVFPNETVDVKSVAEILEALAAYTKRAGELGVPLACSCYLVDGERAPSGYRKLTSYEKTKYVNL